jgi:hypothetical protein
MDSAEDKSWEKAEGRVSPAWSVCHLGALSSSNNDVCSIRSILQARVDDGYPALIHALGYTFDFEYVQRGYIFSDSREGIEIKLFRCCILEKPHEPDSAKALVPPAWIAEASLMCAGDKVESENKLKTYTNRFMEFAQFDKYRIIDQ